MFRLILCSVRCTILRLTAGIFLAIFYNSQANPSSLKVDINPTTVLLDNVAYAGNPAPSPGVTQLLSIGCAPYGSSKFSSAQCARPPLAGDKIRVTFINTGKTALTSSYLELLAGDTRRNTIRNLGVMAIPSLKLDIFSSDKDSFTLTGDKCSSKIVDPGRFCTFDVRCSPKSPRALEANIEVSSVRTFLGKASVFCSGQNKSGVFVSAYPRSVGPKQTGTIEVQVVGTYVACPPESVGVVQCESKPPTPLNLVISWPWVPAINEFPLVERVTYGP